MKLTKQEKEQETFAQIDQMLERLRGLLQKAVKQNLEAGGVPDEYLEEGSLLLAKTAMYRLWEFNPYKLRSKAEKDVAENLDIITPSL